MTKEILTASKSNVISDDFITSKILTILGVRVIIDRELAFLYGVETRRLNEQVKRNGQKFPIDFMFRLTDEETQNWRSQFATSNSAKMGLRRPPYAFTEYGSLQVANILNSDTANRISVRIIRTFVELKKASFASKEILKRLNEIDKALLSQNLVNDKDEQRFKAVFEAIRHMFKTEENKKQIGFLRN